MIARLTHLRLLDGVDPSQVGERLRDVIEAAHGQRGYRGLVGLIAGNGRDLTAISLWESEDDAVANEMNGYYQAQIARFATITDGELSRSHASVLISDVEGIEGPEAP